MQDQREASILGPAPDAQELWRYIQLLNDRLNLVEHKLTYVSTAFPQNDLGKPDYDGHRKAHIELIDQAKVIENYKVTATKKVLTVIISVVFTLGVTAIVDYMRKG
jgi:hypothetical protein